MNRNFEHRIIFNKLNHAVLFGHELQGQISDGMWENSRPFNHWKAPSSLYIELDATQEPKVISHKYFPKVNYNFTSPFLLECVGKRMIAKVKMINAIQKLFNVTNLKKYYFDKDDMDSIFINILLSYVDENETPLTILKKMKKYSDKENDHYDKNYRILKEYDLEKLTKLFEAEEYSMKELKKDLSEIKKILKTAR